MRDADLMVRPSSEVQLAVYFWGQRPTPEQPREIVVLLHGFPDRALFWDAVAQALSQDAWVVAFDMRGCGASTPLQGTAHYRYAPLIDDLYAVIRAVSPHQRVHLVGHDWGALYGWDAVMDPRAAQHVASFTTMAPSLNQVGHWMRARLRRPTPRNLGQLLHQALVSNSLMTFFTLPVLPEIMWRSGLAMRLFARFMWQFEQLPFKPMPGVQADAIRYLGIYRANLLQQVLRPRPPMRTPIPVHALVADRDPFLPPRVFEGCRDWALRYSQSHIDAAHWAPLSRPKEVAAEVRRHLRLHAAASA
jgi:pimeloyl-ACP methyl ester carboxylesterase